MELYWVHKKLFAADDHYSSDTGHRKRKLLVSADRILTIDGPYTTQSGVRDTAISCGVDVTRYSKAKTT